MSALRFIRTYATQRVALPQVQLQGLAGKYATALFSAASTEEASLKKVEADLKAVQKSILSDPKVAEFLSNPILSFEEREATLKTLLPKDASKLTANFFTVLSENLRLYEAEKAIEGYLELMAAHRGEAKVVITSAAPLEKSVLSKLESSLKASQFAANKQVTITNVTDPTILGGIVIDFGDKTIDLSVASQVNKLNNALQAPL